MHQDNESIFGYLNKVFITQFMTLISYLEYKYKNTNKNSRLVHNSQDVRATNARNEILKQMMDEVDLEETKRRKAANYYMKTEIDQSVNQKVGSPNKQVVK